MSRFAKTVLHRISLYYPKGIKKTEQMQEPREAFEQRLELMRKEYETLYEGIEYCKIIVGRGILFFELSSSTNT